MGSLWNRSGVIERYADDLRAAGAKAYFFAGGTTTPLSVFTDAGESAPHPHPVVADANGRWPDVFVPYTLSYDVRTTSADGVQLTFSLGIPNPNPVDVTVTVPAANTVQTGMIYADFAVTRAGYVRLNGKTLGNAASSSASSEYANGTSSSSAGSEPNSAYNLFKYLWDIHGPSNNTVFPVTPTRGGSAAADFDANKAITLPDMRGASFVGLDTMGNVAGNKFPAGVAFSPGSSIIAGSLTGTNGVTLTVSQMPVHSHGGTTAADGGHTHTVSVSGTATTGGESTGHTHGFSGTTSNQSVDHTHTIPTPVNTIGGSGPAASGSGAQLTFSGTTTTSTQSASHTHTISGTTGDISGSHSHSVTVTSSGTAANGGTESTGGDHTHTFSTNVAGGTQVPPVTGPFVTQPFNNLGISRLVTWFIKL